jgi:two-component system CheB/CheR fusion protein
VLKTLVTKELNVHTQAGAFYCARIQPYRTMENVIEGAVITFVDITEVVRIREALHKANELQRLAVVLRDASDAIIMQDLDGRIMAWNPAAVRLYGWSEAEALQMNVRERIPLPLQKEALAMQQRLSRAEVVEPCQTQRIAKSGTILEVTVVYTALLNENGQVYAVATTERGKAP